MENKQEEIDQEKEDRRQEYLAMIKQWEDLRKEIDQKFKEDK